MHTTTLPQDQAHVWYLDPDRIAPAQVEDGLADVLSAEEQARHRRLRFPADRHLYLVSHLLVRRTLSRYADVAPAEWRFCHGDHGRPEIANTEAPELRFNLTHTRGLAACVVTRRAPCGIDVERLDARSHSEAVAERMFSTAEAETLHGLHGRARLEHFYTCWTLREAYVKARGLGLGFATRELTFSVRDDDITLNTAAEIEPRTQDWQFRLLCPDPDHLLAIAIDTAGDSRKAIVVRPASITGS